MKTDFWKVFMLAGLCSVFVVPATFAQDAISGMDMSAMPSTDNAAAHGKPTEGAPSDAGNQRDAMHGIHAPEEENHTAMSDMGNSSISELNHETQPAQKTPGGVQRLHGGERIGVRPVARGLNLKAMSADAMKDMPPMQGGSAPPEARSPDYSEGVGYGDMTGMDMHDDASQTMLLVDKLEYTRGRDANGAALDAEAWWGGNFNKIWLKADGGNSGGRLQDLRTEALWDHAIAAYWDTQLGVRHDFGGGPSRNWAAFGVQGLAPYWFDIDATAYVGQSGRTALRFEAEYELLLTQRLIFQPYLEANLYGRDDAQRRIGSGLSDLNLGLRLRYEFHRQFAPYFGVDLVRKFGRTADFARAAGENAFAPQLVAGVRIWF